MKHKTTKVKAGGEFAASPQLGGYPQPCNKCLFNWVNPRVRDWHCQREKVCPPDPVACNKFKRDKSPYRQNLTNNRRGNE